MSESTRTSALAARHRALGSALEDWNGMGTAWSYHSDPDDEHDAVREALGLFDMSPLKKVWLRGPDAGRVADHAISRDMRRVPTGKSVYGSVLSERGTLCDDAIIANCGRHEYLFCHGSGDSMQCLRESATGLNCDVEFDDDLHNIAVQGPRALQLLAAHTPLDLAALGYFEHAETELFGQRCRISRTGYSGERGYEVFVPAAAAVDIWDHLLGHGQPLGAMACSFTALDKLRIEAALLFYGYDMSDEHTPWEVGLGFTVSADKGDFRGKAAALAARGSERFLAAGIVAEHDGALAGGETLLHVGERVGVDNSPCWSRRMGKSLALCHIRPDVASPGTPLEVRGEAGFACAATVERTPFYDPQKTRTHA